MDRCDVTVVGAGPYGLSAAAHLRQIKGLDLRVFGEPMSFWERHMPEGMLLRSPRPASNLYDPNNQFTLEAFESANGGRVPVKVPPTVQEDFILADIKKKLPLCEFIKYGHWFHNQAGVAADRRKVASIEPSSGGYLITLEDGETLQSRRVVVAGGIQPFAHKPKEFADLPAPLVLHSSEFRDLKGFHEKDVLVVGGGQSALETAALLYEAGARVEVLIRGPVRWFGLRWRWSHEKPFSYVFYGRGDIGQAGVSVLVQHPNIFRKLPRDMQDKFGVLAIRPGASNWVMARTQHVPIRPYSHVVKASVEGERVRVKLNDGTERVVDHVILGTGYRVNISHYPFLSNDLLQRIAMVRGYPRLGPGFESSSSHGLHFVGATAAWSFGPLMRFVDGTEFTSENLTRKIQRSNGNGH